jgi:hypothetical protein
LVGGRHATRKVGHSKLQARSVAEAGPEVARLGKSPGARGNRTKGIEQEVGDGVRPHESKSSWYHALGTGGLVGHTRELKHIAFHAEIDVLPKESMQAVGAW